MNVIERLVAALNAHDLEAATALIDEDYHSEQPAHPGRTFTGRAQMHANWEAIFAGVPDFRADLLRSVQDGDTWWGEWVWSGTRADGPPLHVRGVTLFRVEHDRIVAGRLYLEDVDPQVVGIEHAVEHLSGQRPPAADG